MQTPVAPQVLENLLGFEPLQPSATTSSDKKDPAVYTRTSVSSAHCVDVSKQQLSALDSVAINSQNGSVVHGHFGELPAVAQAIPLEFLALLRPAAQGAAALRQIEEANKNKKKHGTLLIYGASEASGLAAAQLASAKQNAVVAVVAAEHAGNETMLESIKGLLKEPGTAVPEEYALSKANFKSLVHSISTGDEGIAPVASNEYLQDFKQNLLDYVQAYPDTRPAAVSQDRLDFKYMEKDREFFQTNMETFLSQYPPGAPPMDAAKLDAYFSSEQYQVLRNKFWEQTTAVISGDDTPFSPPHVVKQLIDKPETLVHTTQPGAGPVMPYAFSILDSTTLPSDTEMPAGGPILGAIIVMTPNLSAASQKVNAAKSLRAKAEAMQFLTSAQRAAFTAANSVARLAQDVNAPVVVIDSSFATTPQDVQTALQAMDVDESGNAVLNYFVQVYRANDFPFYADYAVHRASEALAGPRQVIVTK